MQADRKHIASRVLWVTLAANTALMAVKFLAGWLGNSGAMVSDAVHTLSDVGTTVLVMVGMRLAAKESDAEHPYGHEKLETLTGLALAAVLALTALGIGYGGLRQLLSPEDLPVPGLFPLLAALLSIAVQEALFHYARRGAKALRSTAMMADAWHHRSDALSSIGSLIGIACARMGLRAMDPIASLGICVAILFAAFGIGRSAARQLLDVSADADTLTRIQALIAGTEGVLHTDSLRTRQHANRLYIDVEIAVNRTVSFEDAHRVAEAVHATLEREIPDVLHCTVHANPHHDDGTPVD